jgi:hypothetical protein
LQKLPVAHCASDEQVDGQLAPAPVQRKGQQLGTPAAFTTFVQVPSAVAPSDFEQKSHEPSHAELQQTPSTQLPLVHSPDRAQVPPSACFATQTCEALQ